MCFLGELPEAEELMAAYETQKIVIAQLQEQIYDEKMRNTEIEGIYFAKFMQITNYSTLCLRLK